MIFQKSEWFSTVYDQWAKRLHRYLYILLRNKGRLEAAADIEDYIQETFIVLWSKREELQAHPNLDAWLFRTASNILNNKLTVASTRTRHTAFSVDELSEGEAEAINRVNTVKYIEQEDCAELLAQVKEAAGDEAFGLLTSYFDKEQPMDTLKRKYKLSASGIKMRVKRALEKICKEF